MNEVVEPEEVEEVLRLERSGAGEIPHITLWLRQSQLCRLPY